jgi:hypothetical protein
MDFRRIPVDVTTDANGAATVYSTPINGRIYSIQYVKDDFADTVDFDLTLQNADDTGGTGEVLWSEDNITASKQICPRQPTHDNAAAASLYAAGGEPVEDYFIACNERVKIVIAQGGDTKSGKFYIKAG